LGRIRFIVSLPFIAMLCACHAVVLNPSGDVAQQQRDLLIYSTVLMLIVIVPVMVMTVLFAWRFRQSNRAARYEPEWDHSIHLELLIWAAPLLIIIGLGGLTWVGTHLLDPYRALGRIKAGESRFCRGAAAGRGRGARLEVAVHLPAIRHRHRQRARRARRPADRISDHGLLGDEFAVHSDARRPDLCDARHGNAAACGRQHAAGDYQGFSANYSGAGFSGMHFVFRALAPADFERWVARMKAGGGELARADYLRLERPSENAPVQGFAAVDPGLYRAILNRCVEAGKPCIDDMMAMGAANDR
jgi:cytochrome o ubiquinol oxidase subunit II